MSLLEVDNVVRAFGSLIAVNGVSLKVEPGELHAVIGPNGAGKTTFFNLDQRLLPAQLRPHPLSRPRHHRRCRRTSGSRSAWRARSRSPRSFPS